MENEIERRVRDLESWRQDVTRKMQEFGEKLDANTAVTTAVKGDTSELVQMWRASKANLAIVRWLASFFGAIGAAIAGFVSWRHWG